MLTPSFKLTPAQIHWVILAGGQASRMGYIDKGLVELKSKPLIEYALAALSPQAGSIMINANRNHDIYQQYAPVISDKIGDFPGPLGGIHAALRYFSENNSDFNENNSSFNENNQDWIGFIPCDSPNIPHDLAQRFCDAWTEKADILVAHDGEFYQPVFSVFHRRVVDKLQQFLASGERKIVRFYEHCDVVSVDFSNAKDTFINLNTLDDVAQFFDQKGR